LSEDDWIDAAWIRNRLEDSGKTQRDIARLLGIDASGVSRLLDGRRKLGAEEARVIRGFFDGTAQGAVPGPSRARANDGRAKKGLPGPRPRTRLSQDIPVYGPIEPDGPHFFRLTEGSPVEYRPCPPQCIGVVGAFALFAPDDALSPRARTGEVLYVHPNRPPVANADVFLRMKPSTDRQGPQPDRIAILRCVGSEEAVLHFVPFTEVDPARPTRRPLSIERRLVAQFGRVMLIATE
jgi:transcriptional regulator with XRE-family HTH domain